MDVARRSLRRLHRFETQAGGLVDFVQGRLELGRWVVLESCGKRRENLCATAVAYGHDEWKPQLLVVPVIELLELPVLVSRALIQAGARLLTGRVFGKLARNLRPAGQVRVRCSRRFDT